jgi:hypothetical protein
MVKVVLDSWHALNMWFFIPHEKPYTINTQYLKPYIWEIYMIWFKIQKA